MQWLYNTGWRHTNTTNTINTGILHMKKRNFTNCLYRSRNNTFWITSYFEFDANVVFLVFGFLFFSIETTILRDIYFLLLYCRFWIILSCWLSNRRGERFWLRLDSMTKLLLFMKIFRVYEYFEIVQQNGKVFISFCAIKATISKYMFNPLRHRLEHLFISSRRSRFHSE